MKGKPGKHSKSADLQPNTDVTALRDREKERGGRERTREKEREKERATAREIWKSVVFL